MIFDNILNCGRYAKYDPSLERAFDFIKKAVEEGYDVGRYEILPDGEMYAFVQEYNSKPECECSFEGHRRYIDVQFLISGCEQIDIIDLSRSESKVKYDVERDIEFFVASSAVTSLVLADGDFGVFYPNDIHRPGMAYADSSPVRKIVVKIKA